MPPPPISSTNTFESLGGMFFIVGPLPRLLSSFAFWSHFAWTTDQLHYKARLFSAHNHSMGPGFCTCDRPSLFHRRLFNLKCIIFIVISCFSPLFYMDLVVSCSTYLSSFGIINRNFVSHRGCSIIWRLNCRELKP